MVNGTEFLLQIGDLENEVKELNHELEGIYHLKKISPLWNPFDEYLDEETEDYSFISEFIDNKGDEIQDFITKLIKEYKELA